MTGGHTQREITFGKQSPAGSVRPIRLLFMISETLICFFSSTDDATRLVIVERRSADVIKSTMTRGENSHEHVTQFPRRNREEKRKKGEQRRREKKPISLTLLSLRRWFTLGACEIGADFDSLSQIIVDSLFVPFHSLKA